VAGGRPVISWMWEQRRLQTRFGSRAGLDAKVAELLNTHAYDASNMALIRLTANYIVVGARLNQVTFAGVGFSGHELVLDELLATCVQAITACCGCASPDAVTAALVTKNAARLRVLMKEIIVAGQFERVSAEEAAKAASLLRAS